jgi:hypothetical protein
MVGCPAATPEDPLVNILGKQLTRQEVMSRIGDISQLGGPIPGVLTEGMANGVRTIDVRSPGGISFVVLLDRGMDIGRAEYLGVPLAWRSPLGEVYPTFAERHGLGWLDAFGGGLLTTCGLATVGQPSVDAGEHLGLHGRISMCPARSVRATGEWVDDEYVITVEGWVREGSALGPVLEMHRRITTTLGQPRLRVRDVVTNHGPAMTPHMFRYHCNFGFPLIGETTQMDVRALAVEPRDEPSADAIHRLEELWAPTAPTAEHVYTVEPSTDTGTASATLTNTELAGGTTLSLRWSQDTLPWLVVWKQLSRGTYVTALEPSNCHDDGRAAERARGTLTELAPGEQRRYELEICIAPAMPSPTT